MFTLAKLIVLVLRPGNLLLLALVIGVGLQWTRFERAGLWLLTAAALLCVAVTLLPLHQWLRQPLEQRFSPPDPMPETVDGILVLGGAVQPFMTAAHGQPGLNQAAERMTAFVGLARRYPAARLVFSGGLGDLGDSPLREADVARQLFAELGLDVGRVVFERDSRDTYENARNTRPLVDPRPGERWLLVTSAAHMPRSVGVFRQVGWPVIPYPVDYRVLDDGPFRDRLDLARNLWHLGDALHEWVGLAVYRLRGRTGALFPRP